MEEFDTITLNDGVGNTIEYYVLDNPKVNHQQYVVLYPIDSTDGEVIIMSVTSKKKMKNDIYASVTDQEDKWLRELPFEYVVNEQGKSILFMHFPIEDINRNYPFYFLSRLRNGSIAEVFEPMPHDMLVFGHAHVSRKLGKAVLVPSTLSDEYEYLIIDIDDGRIGYSRHIVR